MIVRAAVLLDRLQAIAEGCPLHGMGVSRPGPWQACSREPAATDRWAVAAAGHDTPSA